MVNGRSATCSSRGISLTFSIGVVELSATIRIRLGEKTSILSPSRQAIVIFAVLFSRMPTEMVVIFKRDASNVLFEVNDDCGAEIQTNKR